MLWVPVRGKLLEVLATRAHEPSENFTPFIRELR